MKFFIFKTIIFSIFLICLSYGTDFLIEKGIKKSSYREISKWNEVIQGGIDAEILIVGSSRALVHFDPIAIMEKTGMTCYNLGLDGSKFEAQEKVLELYLENNLKPKILIWSLDFGSFQEVEGIYRYEQFIPFWSKPKVKEILALNKGIDLTYLDIPVVRYFNNSAIKYRGLLAWLPVKIQEPTLKRGYRVSNKNWDGSLDRILEQSNGEMTIGFQENHFEEFKQLTQKFIYQNVTVHWIITPYYKTALEAISNQNEFTDFLLKESSLLGASFQDFSSSEVSLSQDNFYNGSHMNKNGVVQFIHLLEL